MFLLRLLVALGITFGSAVAKPSIISKDAAPYNNDVFTNFINDDVAIHQLAMRMESIAPLFEIAMDTMTTLIGYKAPGTSIAKSVVEWLTTNTFMIAIGAFLALAFCKVTGKCTLDTVNYLPPVLIGQLLNQENINAAEKFLYSALKKYSQKKREISGKSYGK